MSIVNLTDSYGYTVYTASNLAAGSVINATGASWNLSNSANQYPDAYTSYLVGSDTINTHPFIIYSAGYGLTIKGGTILGSVPQTSDWQYTYNNSAGIRIDGAAGVIIDDWTMDKVWDGIRIRPINGDSSNWLIDDFHISNARDDAIENDYMLSGTVRDSLFDGVFVGIALAGNSSNPDGSANTVTLDHVMMRSESYLYNGEMTHGSFFKTNTDAPATTPDIRIIDSVFAIEDVTPIHIARLQLAWDNVVESHGNVFLNLSDTPLPSTYPKPPAGFTILQGQQARDYWEACKAAWIDNHDGTPVSDVTALPPLPGAAPAPAPTPIPPSGTTNIINGTNSADTLTGTAGVDQINGSGGIDTIFGKGGSDIITGGAGKDKFVFDTALDGSIDQITDFSTVDDHIYLDNAIFTKLGSGSWSSPKYLSSSFIEDGAGAKADDANDYILYDSNTGILSYDADGNGAGAPIAFAHLTAGLNLSHYDFYVI
ncbi:MAG: calcium-binding protein [Sphingomicrobium sp.]